MWPGGIQHSGSRPSASSIRKCRASVRLGMPLAAAGERSIGRLGQMYRDPGRGQLLGDIPPPGAPLDGERGIAVTGEP
jgi:hypothetical protein